MEIRNYVGMNRAYDATVTTNLRTSRVSATRAAESILGPVTMVLAAKCPGIGRTYYFRKV